MGGKEGSLANRREGKPVLSQDWNRVPSLHHTQISEKLPISTVWYSGGWGEGRGKDEKILWRPWVGFPAPLGARLWNTAWGKLNLGLNQKHVFFLIFCIIARLVQNVGGICSKIYTKTTFLCLYVCVYKKRRPTLQKYGVQKYGKDAQKLSWSHTAGRHLKFVILIGKKELWFKRFTSLC